MYFPRNSFRRSKRSNGAKGVPGSDGVSDKRGPGPGWNPTFSAMNRARVWTISFTMAEHNQQEAIAREGPLYSEELFHLLRNVIHGERISHAMQFAQRSRDTAGEELVSPLRNSVAAAYREPDLAEELDRADEAAEAEVDEETPSPSQQRQLLRAHVNLRHSSDGKKTIVQMSRVRSTTDAENSAGSLAEMLPFQSILWHRHNGSSESAGSRKPNSNIARHLSWDTLPPGPKAGQDNGPGYRVSQSWEILPVVTGLETPWQNSVVERHGALFKMPFEKNHAAWKLRRRS